MKKEGVKLNLLQYKDQYKIIDTDPLSKNYLRFVEFPTVFRAGKNLIKINANLNTLYKGADIYIEILDSEGNPLYYEVPNIIDEDKSRIISVYVYEDTPVGEYNAYFVTTVKKDILGNIIPFENKSNFLWIGSGIISSKTENSSDIYFENEPQVKISEVKINVPKTLTNRLTKRYSAYSASFSVLGDNLPLQFKNSIENSSTFDSVKLIRDPKIVISSSINNTRLNVPEYNKSKSYISSTNFNFSSDMLGGDLEFNNISLVKYSPTNANSSLFQNIFYTCSITNVISNNLVEVYPPFFKKIEYVETDTKNKKTINITNFNTNVSSSVTASYFASVNTRQTGKEQSYAYIKINNLQPSTGDVSQINIKAKTYGEVGSTIDYGQINIEPKDLLFDTESFYQDKKYGLRYKGYGEFQSSADFIYWGVEDNKNDVGSVNILYKDEPLINSMYIEASNHTGSLDWVKVYSKKLNDIDTTGYFELHFNAACQYGKVGLPQMDIYITSSSDLASANVVAESIDYEKNNYNELYNQGTYLGRLVGGSNTRFLKRKYIIKKLTPGRILPSFVIRRGIWHISDVKIYPYTERGFSPNEHYELIPIDKLQRNTEYSFEISYINPKSQTSKTKTISYGLKFDGSNLFIDGANNIITGSLYADVAMDVVLGPTMSNQYLTNGRSALLTINGNARDINGAAHFEIIDLNESSSPIEDPTRPRTDSRTFAISGSQVYIPYMETNVGFSDVRIDSRGKLFYVVSDKKYKKNIKDLTYEDVNKLMQLRPVTFNFKDSEEQNYGLIAQEVEKIFPEFVSEINGNKVIDYSIITSVLIKAVQSLKRDIDYLKNKFFENGTK